MVKTFRYDGAMYSIVTEDGFLEPIIKKFDSVSLTWEPLTNLGFAPLETHTKEYFVVGDWVYSFGLSERMRFHLKTGESNRRGPLYDFSNFSFGSAFQAGDKIYMERFGY
ncbi:hypothetical protein [Algoriphagus sp.]|uniref:hypothetical protein n=1 Tax=Algoriphagus sp. TaxID=1872435 RepID=UPI00262A4736|nr:hypothetical protein [Algoriphagus sp.]